MSILTFHTKNCHSFLGKEKMKKKKEKKKGFNFRFYFSILNFSILKYWYLSD